MTTIHDWNVSRQLWWGHRIPAWYCPDGHVSVSAEPDGPPACGTCARPATELTQDPDIFDTWFSSGLWPFSTLGWPDETDDLKRYYPGTVMETGYDIIFFWVARMMMMGLQLAEDPPFRTVYLHGLVKDPTASGCRRRRATSSTPGGDRRVGRRRAALRPRPRHVARQRPEVPVREARRRPQLRQQALERHALRPRRPSGLDRGGCRPTRPGPGAPRAGGALDPVADGGRGDRGGRQGHGRVPVRRRHASSLRRDLVRVLRLGPGAGQGPTRRRIATGRRARGDVVDARRSPRHLPSAPPPSHALRDRGALGSDARTPPTTPTS